MSVVASSSEDFRILAFPEFIAIGSDVLSGTLAEGVLQAKRAVDSPDYRAYGATLLATRLEIATSTVSDIVVDEVAEVLTACASATSAVILGRSGDEERKSIGFWGGAGSAELVFTPEGALAIRAAGDGNPLSRMLSRHFDPTSDDGIFCEVVTGEGTTGAAWGRGRSFVLDDTSDTWTEREMVGSGDAMAWFVGRLGL